MFGVVIGTRNGYDANFDSIAERLFKHEPRATAMGFLGNHIDAVDLHIML
jgi:hypothetical protein